MSLQSRFRSYKIEGVKLLENKFMMFALCGLYKDNPCDPMVTTCYLCQKSLSYWQDDDIPFDEHLKRHHNCPLYQLHFQKYRRMTFMNLQLADSVKDNLVKNGFFAFPIKDNHVDLFCYKCGFYISGFDDSLQPLLDYHNEECDYKQKISSFSVKNYRNNVHNLFFVDLLSGKHQKFLLDYLHTDYVLVGEQLVKDIKALLMFRDDKTFFLSTRDGLNRCLKNMIKSTRRLMEKDERDIVNLFASTNKKY